MLRNFPSCEKTGFSLLGRRKWARMCAGLAQKNGAGLFSFGSRSKGHLPSNYYQVHWNESMQWQSFLDAIYGKKNLTPCSLPWWWILLWSVSWVGDIDIHFVSWSNGNRSLWLNQEKKNQFQFLHVLTIFDVKKYWTFASDWRRIIILRILEDWKPAIKSESVSRVVKR